MNSQAARFFLYEKWFKSWKKAEKKGKIKRKKLQKIFCLDASTWRDEMPLIKVAYFMLNFLNLKSFPSYLFFIVASSLSTLCCGHQYIQYIHTEIDIDIDCSAGRARPAFLFYFGDTLEDLLRLKESPLKQSKTLHTVFYQIEP